MQAACADPDHTGQPYPPQQYPVAIPVDNPHAAQFQGYPGYAQYPYQQQYMPLPQSLTEVAGVVVRQKAQMTEAIVQTLGLPYEAANKYRISALPVNKVVKDRPDDPDGWEPTAEELERLDAMFFAHEESSTLSRIAMTYLNCKTRRPFRMHLFAQDNAQDVFVIDRPFRLGGCFCCPFEMNVDVPNPSTGQLRRIGRVREDYAPYFSKCCAVCCLCTYYNDIERALPDGTYEKQYSLRANMACCGRVNNCCGATCIKNDAVFDILDTKGDIVAHLQVTYARDREGINAFCRSGYAYNNYLLEFPAESSAEDRMLLLTALFQIDYELFEESFMNNNDNSSAFSG